MKKIKKNTLYFLLKTILFSFAIQSPQAFAVDPVVESVKSDMSALWIVIAAVLVFLMQAGFALLESGSSRTKNTVNVMMKNYIDLCFGSLVFFIFGFGLMMGVNETGFIGTSHFIPNLNNNIDWAILIFQMMFAATAVTIASGAMAERAHFTAYVISASLICGFVYPVFASWVWGGHFGGQGWLSKLGFIDFAGSTVVHSIGGWAALAGVIVLGPRMGRFSADGKVQDIQGHNVTLVALGGFLLWFGWFGFNAGSALDAGANIGKIALNTQLAASSGVIAVMFFAKFRGKSILLTDSVNGSLAGLVAITAGCASMSPGFAILTGLIGGFVYKLGSNLLIKLKIDDVVGAIPVHAFSGAWGTLAAGLFLEGNVFNSKVIVVQGVGVLAAFLWGFILSFIVYKFVDILIGLRASAQEEQRGLDSSEHAEIGYPEFQHHKMFNENEMKSRR